MDDLYTISYCSTAKNKKEFIKDFMEQLVTAMTFEDVGVEDVMTVEIKSGEWLEYTEKLKESRRGRTV